MKCECYNEDCPKQGENRCAFDDVDCEDRISSYRPPSGSAAEKPRQASWAEIQTAMIEEQQAEYDEYVRRCGGVPISNVPPPNSAIRATEHIGASR